MMHKWCVVVWFSPKNENNLVPASLLIVLHNWGWQFLYRVCGYVFRHFRWRGGAAHGPDEGTSVAARLQGQGDTAHHPTPQVRGRHDAGDVPDAPPQHEQATLLPLQEAEPEATTRTLLGRGTQGGQFTHRETDGLVMCAMAGCFGSLLCWCILNLSNCNTSCTSCRFDQNLAWFLSSHTFYLGRYNPCCQSHYTSSHLTCCRFTISCWHYFIPCWSGGTIHYSWQHTGCLFG